MKNEATKKTNIRILKKQGQTEEKAEKYHQNKMIIEKIKTIP